MPDIGPYQILHTLGRGGYGIVHEAEHVETGERVAIKTVRVVKSHQLACLRREVRALSRIRHPGVVRIVDEGEHEGIPYYAMELLAGTTLRSWLVERAAGLDDSTAPLSANAGHARETLVFEREAPPALDGTPPARLPDRYWTEGMTIFRRICEALSYIHGEGIVHRDLKPDNVFVRPDGTAVLVDFGLIAELGAGISRDSLDGGAETAGTLAYMAPEQAAGALPDARTDLYALGCMLYELLAGRPPFLGRSAAEIIWQHARIAPEPLRALVPNVPATIDLLVSRMLAKEPFERLGHADVAGSALAALGAADPPRLLPPARPYVYRPRLSGRSDEMAELTERLERSPAGGALVCVRGETGVGKTRLSTELAVIAARRGFGIVACGATPESALVPFQTLRRLLLAIADVCREKGRNESDRVLGPAGRVLARYEPSLATLPGQQAYPEPVELPAEASRIRVYESLAAALHAFAFPEPLLFLIDDLQWADELSLGFLEYLLASGSLARMPVLACATCRSDETGPAVERLLQAPSAASIALPRLDGNRLSEIVGDMLALSAVSPRLVALLSARSDGNPLYVAEYLRTAVAEGLLERDADGRWRLSEHAVDLPPEDLSLPLPGSLRQLCGRRLGALTPEALHLAAVAAIIGRDVEPWLLWAAAATSEAREIERVQELLARGVLEETAAGGLRFVHDMLREVAETSAPGEARAAAHGRAAAALSALADPEPHQAALGVHWEGAGEIALAAKAYLRAARHASRQFASREAERLYLAALRLLHPGDADARAARLELAEWILHPSGRHEDAWREASAVLDDAMSRGDRRTEASARKTLGLVAARFRTRDAPPLLDDAHAIALSLGDDLLMAQILEGQGVVANLRGEMERSIALRLEANALFRKHEKWVSLALGIASVAQATFRLGRAAEAMAGLEEALGLVEESRDPLAEAEVLATMAVLCSERGYPGDADRHFDRTLSLLESIGHRTRQAVVLGNYATHLHETGRVDAARKAMETAVSVHRRTGNRKSAGITLSNLAVVAIEADDWDRARSLLDEAIALHRDVGDVRSEAISMRHQAVVLNSVGRHEEAIALFESILPTLQVTDRRVEVSALNGIAAAHRKLGRHEEALEHYRQAAAVAREIDDGGLEASALEGMAEVELGRGEPGAASELAARAHEIRVRTGQRLSLAKCLCLEARIAIELGLDGSHHLAEAREIHAALGGGPGALAKTIAELAAAIDARRA